MITTNLLKPNRNFKKVASSYFQPVKVGFLNTYKEVLIPRYVIYRAEYEPPTWYRQFHGAGWRVITKEFVPYRTSSKKWTWRLFWKDYTNYPDAKAAKAAAERYKKPSLHNKPFIKGILDEYAEVIKSKGLSFVDLDNELTMPPLVLADWFEENSCIEAAELIRLVDGLTDQSALAVLEGLYKREKDVSGLPFDYPLTM